MPNEKAQQIDLGSLNSVEVAWLSFTFGVDCAVSNIYTVL